MNCHPYMWGSRLCKKESHKLIFPMLTYVPSQLTNKKKAAKEKQMKLGEEIRNVKKLREEKGRNELKEEDEKAGYVAETKNKKRT